MKSKNKSPSSLIVADEEKRILWFESNKSIVHQTSVIFEHALNKLNKFDNGDIYIFLCGTGGDFFAALRIMDLIKRSKNRINIIAFNYVHSACFTMTQSEITGKILAVEGTKFAFHNAVQVFAGYYSLKLNQRMMLETFDWLKLIDASQALIYCERGRPKSEIFKLLHREAIINVKMAKKLKLIDGEFPKSKFLKIREYIYSKYKAA